MSIWAVYRRSGNFRCKNIVMVSTNNKNKRKIYFTTDNHYSHFGSQFQAQLAGYFAQDGLFDGKRVTTFRSVSDKSSVFTATVHAYGVIRFPLYASSSSGSSTAAW